MKQTKLENGIKELKGIIMTPLEKAHILNSVMKSSSTPDVRLIKSPWSFHIFVSTITRNKLAYYVVIPLIVILMGGGAVFASGNSLPGNFLYPIKVNLVEPIIGSTISNAEAKAKYESQLATKRMMEAETLARLGKLDEKNQRKINDLIEIHTESFGQAFNKINRNENGNSPDEIVTNFHAEMNTHSQILEQLTNNNNKEQKRENQISEKAREKADRVLEYIKNKNQNYQSKGNEEDNKEQPEIDKEKYNNKRDNVPGLINQVRDNADQTNKEDKNTEERNIDKTN